MYFSGFIAIALIVNGHSLLEDLTNASSSGYSIESFPESIAIPTIILSTKTTLASEITTDTATTSADDTTITTESTNTEQSETSTQCTSTFDEQSDSTVNIENTTQLTTTNAEIAPENCTIPYLSRFPTDLFTNRQRQLGALIFHIILATYALLAVSFLVEEYFSPSLERLSEVVKLDEDITGATFMAAGSSAPEVFIAIIGSMYANSDVGIGAVVGSAVFNILFVIGICAVLTPSVVKLSWWPFLRDSCYYCISAIVLVLCIMDGKIYWYESMILLVLYIIYIVILCFNRKIQTLVANLIGRNALEADFLLIADDGNQPDGYKRFDNRVDYDSISQSGAVMELNDVDDETPTFALPKRTDWVGTIMDNFKKYSMLPLKCCFLFTIPDCRQYRFRMLFPVTFILSVAWLGVWCYLLVWMVATIGYTLGIPDSVMGITFLAAGTSIPDTLASIHAVKTGHVNMGVSNTIGSNLFDLLIALALPWLIRNLSTKQFVVVNSRGLSIDTVLLVGTVIAAVISIKSKGFYLDRKLGTLLLGFYMVYLIISLMIELNVFGFVNPTMCAM
ncbi:hypothetical protein ACOME3_001738 [Neoechinorhynchus agilis]